MIHSQDIIASSLAELLLTWAMTFGDSNAMCVALSPGEPCVGGVPFPGPLTLLVRTEATPSSCKGLQNLARLSRTSQSPAVARPQRLRARASAMRHRCRPGACSGAYACG